MKKAKFEKFMAKQFLKRIATSSLEVEQKYRVADIHAMRKALKKSGAVKIFSGQEHNELYDANKMLRERKQILRLRYHGPNRAWLTFKGPRLKGRHKKRIEIETHVRYEETKRILFMLGFRMISNYRKYREEFKATSAKVYLDYLPRAGWFIEIEGLSKAIHQTAKKLGLDRSHCEDRSYRKILEESVSS